MAPQHEEEVLGKAYDSRLMRRIMTYLRPYTWQVVMALLAIVLKAGADVLGPYLTKVAVDRYLVRAPGTNSVFDSFLSSKPLTGIAEIAAVYVLLLGLSFLFDFLQTYFMQWTGQMAMFDLRKELFRHLQRMQIGFYDKNPVGRLVTRVTSDVDALNEMFTSGVVSIFEDVFVLAGIVGIMLHMDWKLALITFAVLPLIGIATKIFRDNVRASYRRIRVAIARINAYLQEHVSGMVVLQLFNREQRAFEEFSKVNEVHMEAFKDAIWAHAVYYPIVEILSAIAIACVIWFGGHDVIAGAATLGVLVAFIQYAQRFFRPIQDLSEKYNILQSAMAASERIFKMLDAPVEITSPAVSQEPSGPGRIEFDHVWFTYGSSNGHVGTGGPARPAGESHASTATDREPDWILRDVSFTIEPGETVAIVGHTGAGKTTIISLLMRFYDVQKGAIALDGVDIREMKQADVRKHVGVVLQDPFIFAGTIASNIRLNEPGITDEQVRSAARFVNADKFIDRLPEGYETVVTERGSTLSVGQKQLLAFARAIAFNPEILLVLDEATSSVDTETEHLIQDALAKLMVGRTSIIIAHRLSTIQNVDRIIVLHKGRVVEVGTHRDLLAQRGVYHRLYELQYRAHESESPTKSA
jgi:ATP-binding cassette subfamily B multidrug efflux pump